MKQFVNYLFLSLISFITINLCYANDAAITPSPSCLNNPALQQLRSNELQDLVKADQAIREHGIQFTANNSLQMMADDLKRRKRVGEIFGEGCFKTSADYSAAALIYQHGEIPDHFFQAFLWSKRANELGDKNSKSLSAMAIDRYLVSTGKKQLFGTQFFAANVQSKNLCFCIEPVEKSVTDKFRVAYAGMALSARYQMLAEINKGKSCPPPENECDKPLQASPKGTVIGLW